MNDLGAMMTSTAVIATIIALLFAVAAFFVQRHKERSPALEDPPHPSPQPDPRVDSKPNASAGAESKRTQPEARPPEISSAAPLFRRYTPHGSETPVVTEDQNDDFDWE